MNEAREEILGDKEKGANKGKKQGNGSRDRERRGAGTGKELRRKEGEKGQGKKERRGAVREIVYLGAVWGVMHNV